LVREEKYRFGFWVSCIEVGMDIPVRV
jgi:hypothetical protein